jgi:hypothetical protein
MDMKSELKYENAQNWSAKSAAMLHMQYFFRYTRNAWVSFLQKASMRSML